MQSMSTLVTSCDVCPETTNWFDPDGLNLYVTVSLGAVMRVNVPWPAAAAGRARHRPATRSVATTTAGRTERVAMVALDRGGLGAKGRGEWVPQPPAIRL